MRKEILIQESVLIIQSLSVLDKKTKNNLCGPCGHNKQKCTPLIIIYIKVRLTCYWDYVEVKKHFCMLLLVLFLQVTCHLEVAQVQKLRYR